MSPGKHISVHDQVKTVYFLFKIKCKGKCPKKIRPSAGVLTKLPKFGGLPPDQPKLAPPAPPAKKNYKDSQLVANDCIADE